MLGQAGQLCSGQLWFKVKGSPDVSGWEMRSSGKLGLKCRCNTGRGEESNLSTPLGNGGMPGESLNSTVPTLNIC